MTIASAPAAGATDARLAHAIRFLAIDAIVRAGEGHQGVPLGMAEIATALYTRHLKFDAADPTWPDRDRVVLSNGHGSMLLYALLHLTGYARISHRAGQHLPRLRLALRRPPGARPGLRHRGDHRPARPGHCQRAGHGGGRGAWLNARFGPGVVDHRYLRLRRRRLPAGRRRPGNDRAGRPPAPGQAGAAVGRQPHHRRRRTELSISEDVAERFRVAGWHVQAVDGHDIEAVTAAFAAAKADPRPSLIACRTVIARGIARLQGQRGGHSAGCSKPMRGARAIGWPHAPFEVPADVLRSLAHRRRPRHAEREHLAAARGRAARRRARRVRAR
jgi:transketolase